MGCTPFDGDIHDPEMMVTLQRGKNIGIVISIILLEGENDSNAEGSHVGEFKEIWRSCLWSNYV
ncbi:hypothetical protein SK128_001091, partial [Halocaridina rubra]